MNITVKLFAQYRQNKFNEAEKSYPENTTIEQVIKDIGIDIEKYPIGIILINGRHADEKQVLQNNDVLSIFPKVGGG